MIPLGKVVDSVIPLRGSSISVEETVNTCGSVHTDEPNVFVFVPCVPE